MSNNAFKKQRKSSELLTEDEWLSLLRAGDHKAFAGFIDKYKETVFLCCRKIGLNEDETEDVAGETFLAAYRSIHRYKGQSELSTWLWSIAYRQAVNFLRKHRRGGRDLEAEPDSQGGRTEQQQPDRHFIAEPDATAQNKETGQIVWEAVDRLPKLWAMAVILYYREEKSISDIAEIMCTKENTVKTYLYRARERLKGTLCSTFGQDF